MAKFYGNIGFVVKTVETSPSVWEDRTKEFPYCGDVLKNEYRWSTGQSINDDININNRISIIGDERAFKNFHFMKYVIWNGVKWKISNVEVSHPRLILSLGGLYNEE